MLQQKNLALELIEKEKREKTGFLDLGNCGLSQLPEAVRELVWLKSLALGELYINKKDEWWPSGNKAERNTIARLPDWLAELSGLQVLLLDNTLVDDFLPLSGLSVLQSLFFYNTPVADLKPLAWLSELQKLNCSKTPVDDLSPLADLSRLQTLHCSSTPVADLSPLAGLTELRTLDCSNTRVTDLSPFWPKIQAGWPVRWTGHDLEFGIHVENCPLIIPPVEFAIEGPEAVVEYFEQLGDEGRPLNEVKVIFLGEGASGKTSLIKRLRKEKFDPKESQTHGIRIQKTPFDFGGETITAHCWDFGGQEVNHATHQFFLSQRCVYVVVLNSRSDDKAEKWLKHASSFGGRSPVLVVLVVLNKIDENPSFEVGRKRLRKKYPNIQDFFRLSCASGQGVAEFHQALAGQIEQAPTRRTPFPAAWLKVKEHFAYMRPRITSTRRNTGRCAGLTA